MEYIHTHTIKKPGAVVRVFRPVLDEGEKNRRMKRLHDAAADLLKEKFKKRGTQNA